MGLRDAVLSRAIALVLLLSLVSRKSSSIAGLGVPMAHQMDLEIVFRSALLGALGALEDFRPRVGDLAVLVEISFRAEDIRTAKRALVVRR